MFFLFLFENTEMRLCTSGVCLRAVIHHHKKRCLNSWADSRLKRRHTLFSHKHFSYWLVFLCWMSTFSGSQIRFLASGLYSWVSGHRDLGTCRLVYTVSLSLLASLENTRPQENSPQSIGLWLGSAMKTWPIQAAKCRKIIVPTW